MIKIGNICRDANNSDLAVVTDVCYNKELSTLKMCYGVTLDGKPWQSTRPLFISSNVNAYIKDWYYYG